MKIINIILLPLHIIIMILLLLLLIIIILIIITHITIMWLNSQIGIFAILDFVVLSVTVLQRMTPRATGDRSATGGPHAIREAHYTYMYIYIYIYIYTYVCVCTYIYIYIYIYTHVYVYMCVYIYIYTHKYIFIEMYTSISLCICICDVARGELVHSSELCTHDMFDMLYMWNIRTPHACVWILAPPNPACSTRRCWR